MSVRLKSVTANDVIRMLIDSESQRGQVPKIIARVKAHVLVEALRAANVSTIRGVLCDLLGFRHDAAAVPVLMEMLDDLDPSVRASAADAIAKIGDPKTGRALEEHFRFELSSEVRSMLAAALGAVGRRQAIPLLIESLNDPWAALRGCAAWSLGHLRALSAEAALGKAVKVEQDAYPRKRMECALREIRRERTRRVARRTKPAPPRRGRRR